MGIPGIKQLVPDEIKPLVFFLSSLKALGPFIAYWKVLFLITEEWLNTNLKARTPPLKGSFWLHYGKMAYSSNCIWCYVEV